MHDRRQGSRHRGGRCPIGSRAERGYALCKPPRDIRYRLTEPHHALDDALVTAQLFLALAGKFEGVPEPTVADLRRLAP